MSGHTLPTLNQRCHGGAGAPETCTVIVTPPGTGHDTGDQEELSGSTQGASLENLAKEPVLKLGGQG